MSDEQTIFVYEQFSQDTPSLMGKLYAETAKGQQHVSFEFEPDWLKEHNGLPMLDPQLQFFRGRQYPVARELFAMFSDACPDRWGRVLMQRREASLADTAKRKPKSLTEIDYLLGVNDASRMGALRFALEEGGSFVSEDETSPVPPWVKLRELEQASLNFESDKTELHSSWLNQLVVPGSSLGGARPKATVQDPEGNLWIAKFPSKNDDINAGAWEKVAYDLAELCGIETVETKLENFSSAGSTFLAKRFDREGGRRIQFASAMTMLDLRDGDQGSYLDIASFLTAHGAKGEKDLHELWCRVVFNMAISNTDDHMRNHGFLLEKKGWRLSAVYDINPVPYGEHLATLVTEESSLIFQETLLAAAPFFGLGEQDAQEKMREMGEIVTSQWEALAKQYGIERSSIEYMRPAFSFALELAQ